MTEQDLNTLAKVREALRLMQFKYAAMAADGGPNHYERHDIAQRLAVTLARIPEQAEPTATGGGDALRRLGWSMILGVPTYERVPGSDEWATVTNTVPIETWHAAVDEAKGQRVPDLLPTSPSRGGGEPDVLVDLSTYSKWCAATGQRPTDEARTAWEAGRNIALKSQPPTDELRERVEVEPDGFAYVEGHYRTRWKDADAKLRRLNGMVRGALLVYRNPDAKPWSREHVTEWLEGVQHEIERAALAATQPSPLLAALLELHDAVWKDECSATYCACQSGGMVYLAARNVDALRAATQPEAPDAT
jgi:hypothetical protein